MCLKFLALSLLKVSLRVDHLQRHSGHFRTYCAMWKPFNVTWHLICKPLESYEKSLSRFSLVSHWTLRSSDLFTPTSWRQLNHVRFVSWYPNYLTLSVERECARSSNQEKNQSWNIVNNPIMFFISDAEWTILKNVCMGIRDSLQYYFFNTVRPMREIFL